MTSMCGSNKAHATMNAGGYYRPGPYAYQSDYYMPPRSTWSRVSAARTNGNATWKFGSAILIISAMLVLIAVLAIAGLALWMGALRTDSKNAIVGFSCNFRITRGEKYNPMLKLNTSMVFREKERKFKNILELLFRRSVLGTSYKRTTIDKFENGTLKVFFRLYLDRRKIPRSITNVEDTIRDVIVKETYSTSSLFKDMELDLASVSVKRITQESIVSSKGGQQKHTMITKNGLLRPNRNSSLIMSFKQKARPSKTDSNEPDIDFNNIPTIQGTYKATKVNVTVENSTTGGTSELTTDNIKDAVRRVPSREQSTTSKILDFVGSSTTSKPSTFLTRPTATLGEDKWSEKSEDETKMVTSSTSATTQSDHPDVFKDFRNPDFETSPWRPIVPGYVNTEFKLLPDDNTKEKNRVESSTRRTISSTNDHRNDAGIDATSSAVLPGLPLQSVNFGSVVGMSTFDTDNTDFPRDRIVPGLTAFKPEVAERPDIEVAGQLPPETYSVKLKASSKRDDNHDDGKTSENFSKNDVLLQGPPKTDSNMTRGTQEKMENSLSTVEPGDSEPHRSDNHEKITNESTASGVGVAEPVLDPEVELNARNRYGIGILASDTVEDEEEKEDTELRDRKVDVNPQRPVYTSYNTPDLNGDNGAHRSSLISNSATMKPFRHTIPVDKIASVVSYSESSFSNNAATDRDESRYKNVLQSNSYGFINKNATLLPPGSETVVETETFVMGHDTTRNGEQTMTELPSYGQIMSPESDIVPTDVNDDKFSRLEGNEEGSSELKLIVESVDSRKSVSRNSTFVEIDTVKHTPGQLDDHLGEVPAAIGTGDQQRKKVYNDTLKAYVVENLVTLAPAKSNTGIGRPVRPRPKSDLPTDETTLLEQLFRLRDYMDERETTTIKPLAEHLLADETMRPESAELSENESSTRKGSAVVQQIIEVVTSVSTKVSSSMKGDPIVLKLIAANSTTSPIIRADHEEDRSLAETGDMTKTVFSWTRERPSLASADLRIMQTASEENPILLEKLKQLAQIRTDDDSARIARNGSNSSTLQTESSNVSSLNIDELRKIADVVTGNETLKNASLEFTLSRDGVKIFTKVLNKAENRTMDELIRNVNEPPSNDNCTGYRCRDGKCLDSSAMCNMLVECADSEDEINCTCADFLKAQLLYEKMCDGIVDCSDYSDESDCDWCKKGQFVCGNSKSCIDQDKVCNGFSDCPGDEDEKKCTALIDNEQEEIISESHTDLASTDHLSAGNNYSESGRTAEELHLDQEAVESSIIDATTLYALPDDLRSELNDKNNLLRQIDEEFARRKDADKSETVAVSSREISSSVFKNALTKNNPHSRKEIESYNYNSKGYLSVRKNGKWGKLCLSDPSQGRQGRNAWSIEDLAKAACKAITYQDYEAVEKVPDQNPPPNRFYYTLSNDNQSDESLSFESSECPSGDILKVRCKNIECGIRTQGTSTARIVGGASSSVGSWPWQVAVYKNGDYQCGGALINERWIASAAHCFYHAQDDYWVARIGATRRGSFHSPYEQLLRLDHISLHPDYIDNGFVNDIAVLRLERAVTFTDYVRPVCLPTSPVVQTGTVCVVTGWGQLYEIGRVFPDTLQEVQLPVISTEDCWRKTLFLPLYRITSAMLCAGLENGTKDACLGDSGGPLVCLSENRYVLQGITSNGYGCGRRERPGVYTKIYHFLDYIDRIITRKDIQPSPVAFCKGHRCPLGECLPKSRVCNGFLECSDGSDERDCPTVSQ
ncbi:Enteropeptidase [Ooceraea biroi]|uniref:Enteropeptidase n=1 Tax=Ooceraea biroi TaxID=2015173 RepID=A0A026VY88_OOCBI|nr:Enteropeptidase [Ooceraea biroi]